MRLFRSFNSTKWKHVLPATFPGGSIPVRLTTTYRLFSNHNNTHNTIYKMSLSNHDLNLYGLRDLTNGLLEFPIESNSVFQLSPETVKADARATRIVVHPRFPDLVQKFLNHKRLHGSNVEKGFYHSNWTWRDQVRRLLEKRPLQFLTGGDHTMGRDMLTYGSITDEWDRVGTDSEIENHYVKLAEYLSYDEIMLSSLLGVSGPSQFWNDGSRNNCGVRATQGAFEPRGIIMGLVGARFERKDCMDSIYILKPVKNPRQHPELTEIFLDFFGCREIRNPSLHFDEEVYKRRIHITAEILLIESNERAKEVNKKAYVYVVGLGLGVWAYGDQTRQSELYCHAFFETIAKLGDSLTHVRTIEFAYIDRPYDWATNTYQSPNRQNKIKLIFSNRNPAAKLSEDEQGDLLCLSYAWDGNSFPGNEYWGGGLAGSGDPAAACMSTISHLHNPMVNPDFLDRIKVIGSGTANTST
ncbi:hypothetical protein F5Y16DRAFT_369475 [Xylariaceae sp. FL0255]|nr:hypothetical protein F5Y16DRAFT_369475 [Xylariaceae sp. FL0255]